MLVEVGAEVVGEFLADLRTRLHAEKAELLARIEDSGKLSEEDEEELGAAIGDFVDDFGADFDQNGEPIEAGESERIKSAEERRSPRRGRGVRRVRGGQGGDAGLNGRRSPAMATQKEVKNRIASIKNINKITRAMEMVAAARLRRAEQRIEALRPYAEGMRKLTRRAAEQAGGLPRVAVLDEHESLDQVGVVLVTGDRGLAGAFNTNVIREGMRARRPGSRGGGRAVLLGDRSQGGLDAQLPQTERAHLLHRLHRPPRLCQRPRDRRGADRQLRRSASSTG